MYYGVFPGKRVDAQGRPTSAWVVSRPHNWKPKSTLEQLLEIDMTTGAVLCLGHAQLLYVETLGLQFPAYRAAEQCKRLFGSLLLGAATAVGKCAAVREAQQPTHEHHGLWDTSQS